MSPESSPIDNNRLPEKPLITAPEEVKKMDEQLPPKEQDSHEPANSEEPKTDTFEHTPEQSNPFPTYGPDGKIKE